jgi:hypothetical protein
MGRWGRGRKTSSDDSNDGSLSSHSDDMGMGGDGGRHSNGGGGFFRGRGGSSHGNRGRSHSNDSERPTRQLRFRSRSYDEGEKGAILDHLASPEKSPGKKKFALNRFLHKRSPNVEKKIVQLPSALKSKSKWEMKSKGKKTGNASASDDSYNSGSGVEQRRLHTGSNEDEVSRIVGNVIISPPTYEDDNNDYGYGDDSKDYGYSDDNHLSGMSDVDINTSTHSAPVTSTPFFDPVSYGYGKSSKAKASPYDAFSPQSVAGTSISTELSESAPSSMKKSERAERARYSVYQGNTNKKPKFRVRPYHCFPDGLQLTEEGIYTDSLKPSQKYEFLQSFIAGSKRLQKQKVAPDVRELFGTPQVDGRIGSLRVEVLGCVSLARQKPDISVYMVCGDCAYNTDVIHGYRSPMWPNRSRRACVFPLHHAYARLFVGVFDVRVRKNKENDVFCGRVSIDVAGVRRYDRRRVGLVTGRSMQPNLTLVFPFVYALSERLFSCSLSTIVTRNSMLPCHCGRRPSYTTERSEVL